MKKTAKTVTFFPNCKKCKTPTVAATTDEPITLNLRFNRPQNPSEVHFVLTKDGEDAVRYAMNLVKDEDNVRLMRHNGVIFFLDRALERLAIQDPSRPLSSSREAVEALYVQRLPLYRRYSDMTIDNNGAQEDTVRLVKERFDELACT